MKVFDVCRNGLYQRQIVAHDLTEAQLWVSNYMPGCTVRKSYNLDTR